MKGKKSRSGKRGNHPIPPSKERLTVAFRVAVCLSAKLVCFELTGGTKRFFNEYAHSVSMSRKGFSSAPMPLNICREWAGEEVPSPPVNSTGEEISDGEAARTANPVQPTRFFGEKRGVLVDAVDGINPLQYDDFLSRRALSSAG
ncbi:MAG: hypothetical protein M0Z38_02540 [Deltaproteobacteria bacterium]|nr:hypothetical protein [Deltaproteobacteria bacterium]